MTLDLEGEPGAGTVFWWASPLPVPAPGLQMAQQLKLGRDSFVLRAPGTCGDCNFTKSNTSKDTFHRPFKSHGLLCTA